MALLSCDLLTKPPRLSGCQDLLQQMPDKRYRHIYSLTLGLLTLPDHPNLSTADRKMQVCTAENSEPLRSCVKHAAFEI